ncbi:MAG: UvrD-helicase domain-containing protein [Pirellulaceae bacterium]|nr:UvrD-helicase domain-containing protein [Pirellulaceae bacterium]
MSRRSKKISSASAFPNTIVEASAGSGKTFALTNRYLGLLASGVSCENILATTFTRKAAGEILDRVMQRLTAAATDPKASKELERFLDQPLAPNDAIRILRQLAENLHRLLISTLDSFFYQIAQSFSFELGLPVDWKIAENGQVGSLAEIAVRNLLHDENVREFLHLIVKGDADRKVADLMIDQVNRYAELYRDSIPAAWNHPSPRVFDSKKGFAELLAAAQNVEPAESRQRTAFLKDLELIEADNWDDLLKSGMLGKVMTNDLTYYRKPLDSGLVEFYERLVDFLRGRVTTIYSQRTLSAWRLIDLYSQALWPLQLAAGELRFSDVTHLVKQLVQQGSLNLESRLDQNIEHLLLDEFQDTSPAQWQILRPFVEKLFCGMKAGSFFCVGDRKQAIYAWRGGVSQMFDVVTHEYGEYLEPAQPLTTSFRSSPIVIDFVNRVFENLGAWQGDREFDQTVLSNWAKRFPKHTTARNELPGHVLVEQVHDPEGGKGNDKLLVFEKTVASIVNLHREAPQISIGVLVSTHEDIAQLLFLLHQRGIPASEEGGNPLTDSAAVNLLLAALKVADHPGDGVARYLISHSPLACVIGLVPEDQSSAANNREQTAKISLNIRREIIRDGYGKVLERWAKALDDSCTTREKRRVDQLVEFAYEYDEPWTLRTSHFIKVVQETKIMEPSAAMIRVMTVHAAKGLEFQAVFAPFLSLGSQWTGNTPHVVYSRSEPGKPIDLVHLYCNETERSFLPERIQNLFLNHRCQTIEERVCMLYVWMTRAIHHLHVILPGSIKPHRTTQASLLLSTLSSAEGDNKESNSTSEIVFENGDHQWFNNVSSTEQQLPEENLVFFEPVK